MIEIPKGAEFSIDAGPVVPGFDGHSLRAHSYFGEQMPDIQLAPEGARCFEAKIGKQTIWFHEQETLSYLGQEMTGLELWERLANVRVAA